MKPSSEYILTKIKEEENTQEKNQKPSNQTHRVEFFINNEHKGTYDLESIDEKQKNKTK